MAGKVVYQQTHFGGKWVDFGGLPKPNDPGDPHDPPPPVNNIPWVVRTDLPFNVPARNYIEDAGFPTGPHYFLSFPISVTDIDTTLKADGTPVDPSDYRYRWMSPGSVEGGVDNKVWGGSARDYHALRRKKRVPMTSPTARTTFTLTWAIQDKMDEVREAVRAGFDVFFVDILQVPQSATDKPIQWTRLLELFEAVAEVQRQDNVRFKIVLMPDGTTSASKNPTTLIDALKYLINTYPDVVYMLDGEILLAPYQPEGGTGGILLSGLTPLNFWQTVIDGVKSLGKGCKFWPCYQKDWTATGQHPTLTSLCYGMMIWGDRDREAVRSDSNSRARRAYWWLRTKFSATQKYAHYVAPGDQRPSAYDSAQDSSIWWEQDHLETLIGCWEAAIGDETAKDANGELYHRKADMVQNVTWSDIFENAHIMPSHNHGRTLLMVNWYYLIKYKTGQFPDVARDCLILSHKNQPTDDEPNTTVTYPADTLQTRYHKAPRGSTPAQNTISVAGFLTAPARVYISYAGVDHDMGMQPAGFFHGLTIPIAPIGDGLPSAYAIRDAKMVVNLPASTDPLFKIRTVVTKAQDYTYKIRDSINMSEPVKTTII
jgi:hypothetical protein